MRDFDLTEKDLEAVEEMAEVIRRTEQIANGIVGAPPSATMIAKDLYWSGYRRRHDHGKLVVDIDMTPHIVDELRSKKSRDNRDLLDRAANLIETLEDLLEARAVIIKMLEGDVEDRDRMLEAMVEDVHADFMRDYKYMKEELDAAYDEMAFLRNERDEARRYANNCPNCGAKMKGGAE